MTASNVAEVGREAPALLRWATRDAPGVAARSASTSMAPCTVRRFYRPSGSQGLPGPWPRWCPVDSG